MWEYAIITYKVTYFRFANVVIQKQKNGMCIVILTTPHTVVPVN
uniref:Uncharacterized protein n=1 Tax=Anguilla anguilla TaxID=7936 RepID=A0A0E9UND6_ANGAN